MRASTRRILSILISGILFMATIVVYAKLIQPSAFAIGSKRQVVFSKKVAFQNQKDAVERVRELVAEFQGATRIQDTMELVMPLSPSVTSLLAQLQAISRSSQVSLNSFSISFLPFKQGSNALVRRLGVLEFSISVSGDYVSVKSFFRALEQNVRLLTIQTMGIKAEGGDRNSFGEFVGDAVVRAYYQP